MLFTCIYTQIDGYQNKLASTLFIYAHARERTLYLNKQIERKNTPNYKATSDFRTEKKAHLYRCAIWSDMRLILLANFVAFERAISI